MELVASTGQAAELSSNGILIRNSSNDLLEEEPGLEEHSESLSEDVPNEHLSEEVSNQYLLEAPNKSFLVEMPIEGLVNESHPEEVPGLPGESVSFEVSSKSVNEEVFTTIVTEVPSTVVVEETSNLDLSQSTVNNVFEIVAAEVLFNGAKDSNASREPEHVPGVGVVEVEVVEVQTNGWKPEVYDASILLPSWNQARGTTFFLTTIIQFLLMKY